MCYSRLYNVLHSTNKILGKCGRICSALQGFRRGSGGAMLRTPRVPFVQLNIILIAFCTHLVYLRHELAKNKTTPNSVVLFFGDPWENRTPVTAVKGRCLSRLTNGPNMVAEIGLEPMTYRV